jgi:hypothetical protein
MGYKYVLVGVYYEGKEPTFYPTQEEFDWDDAIFVETEIVRLLQTSKWNKATKNVTVGVIMDGLTKEWFWRRWTWRHVGEVIGYFLWRVYLASRKVIK